MKRINKYLVILVSVFVLVVLCSCGDDYHEKLPVPFSDLHPEMTKDEIKNQFASLGIKEVSAERKESFVGDGPDYEIENYEICHLSGDVWFRFNSNDTLHSCSWQHSKSLC